MNESEEPAEPVPASQSPAVPSSTGPSSTGQNPPGQIPPGQNPELRAVHEGLVGEEVPLWRDEFPLTSGGEEYVVRRDFTRYLLTASVVFAAGTVGAAAWASLQRSNTGQPRKIVALSEVPKSSEYLFRYPTENDPAILVHLPDGELRAFSQKCTHLGCVVYYQPEKERLFCPCHHGIFEPSSGEPTAGPPERPLNKIDIEVRDGVIWAKGAEV